MPYTVTIYVAAPGTPLLLEKGDTSIPGHMFYTTNDGQKERSYGFAPIESEHGHMLGQGKIYSNDITNYESPVYSRTMEVSKAQYDKLNEFGQAPEKHGFDLKYGGTWNNCVDFAWGGLNHAGLHYRTLLGLIDDKNYEGSLKPTHNIHDIKEIKAPFPSSPLNQERKNPWPEKRNLTQWMLSENDKPVDSVKAIAKNSSIDDMIDSLYVAAITKDDKASYAVTHAYLQSDDGKGFIAQGKEFNQQIKANEQKVTFEAQQALNQQTGRGGLGVG